MKLIKWNFWILKEHNNFFFLFVTSFSGHRPAQRECARTGLRSHARWHPYPIPQPVQVDDTTGVYDPYSVLNSDMGSFTSHKNKSVKVLRDGTHGFFRPYPRRLECLTICRCHFKGALPTEVARLISAKFSYLWKFEPDVPNRFGEIPFEKPQNLQRMYKLINVLPPSNFAVFNCCYFFFCYWLQRAKM